MINNCFLNIAPSPMTTSTTAQSELLMSTNIFSKMGSTQSSTEASSMNVSQLSSSATGQTSEFHSNATGNTSLLSTQDNTGTGFTKEVSYGTSLSSSGLISLGTGQTSEIHSKASIETSLPSTQNHTDFSPTKDLTGGFSPLSSKLSSSGTGLTSRIDTGSSNYSWSTNSFTGSHFTENSTIGPFTPTPGMCIFSFGCVISSSSWLSGII